MTIEQQIKGLYVSEAIKSCVETMQLKRVKQAESALGIVYLDEAETEELEVKLVIKRKKICKMKTKL